MPIYSFVCDVKTGKLKKVFRRPHEIGPRRRNATLAGGAASKTVRLDAITPYRRRPDRAPKRNETVATAKQALRKPAALAPINISGFSGNLCARITAIAQKPAVKLFRPSSVTITLGFIFKPEKGSIRSQL